MSAPWKRGWLRDTFALRSSQPRDLSGTRLGTRPHYLLRPANPFFIWGSLVATFSQGVALGAFIEGIKVVERKYAGGALDWLTPFSLFCGRGLVIAYTLLGCTGLVMKTEGPLQQRMHDVARPLALVLLVVIAVVSLWTPLAYPQIAARWFSMPNLFWFMPVPILVLVTFYGLLRAVARNAHYTPFLLTLALIFQMRGMSDEDKLRALQLRASRRGLHLTDEVGHFILTRGTRSMSALFDLLERLDQASLQAQRKLTIPFLKETLGW